MDVKLIPPVKSFAMTGQALKAAKAFSPKDVFELDCFLPHATRRAEKLFHDRGVRLKFVEVDDYGDQAYRIEVGKGGIIVCGRDQKGLLLGYRTLVQIAAQCQRELPCCVIEDAPALRLRAFLLDLRVQKYKPAYLKELFTELARLKYNAVIIEYADAFPFSRERLVTATVHYSPEQVAEVRKAAAGAGIDVIPLQSTLGRLEYVLGLLPYHEFAGRNAAASYLHENNLRFSMLDPRHPGALKLALSLLDEVMDAHDSPYVHVGLDDTELLGWATDGAGAAGRKSAAELFETHAEHVLKHVIKNGRTPIIWSEGVERFPQCLARLPKQTIIAVRHEDGPEHMGARLKMSADAGFRVLAAPSARCCPDNECARETGRHVKHIADAARAARTAGAAGVIITSWATHDRMGFVYRDGAPCGFAPGSRRMHHAAHWYAVAAGAALSWNPCDQCEQLVEDAWPRVWFGSDDKRLTELQFLQEHDAFQGADNAEIQRDRKRVLRIAGDVKPMIRAGQLELLSFYARLSIHRLHARNVFKRALKPQEIEMLRGERERLIGRHKSLMSATLFSSDIAEEREHFFGDTGLLLSRFKR
ncbi:family 20 glycosylhydrolase [bacterium]|nr:family 20 glycosylhydrolase [bacterium]